MRRCQDNGLVYYCFESFLQFPQVVHGAFTRYGGVSSAPCEGLNLAFLKEDTEENVQANLDLVGRSLGLNSLVFTGQVHGDRALVIRSSDRYQPRTRDEVIGGYDAIITPDPEVGLVMKLADCQGVLLFDPNTDVLAAVHAGWRGSVQNILGKTVARLEKDFGINPSDLLVGISPSLGPCCAEFINYRQELPESFWDYRNGNHFNFWSISRDQLAAAGVNPQNVEVSEMCTKCGREGFYSYRGEKVTGRFGLIAGVRKEN